MESGEPFSLYIVVEMFFIFCRSVVCPMSSYPHIPSHMVHVQESAEAVQTPQEGAQVQQARVGGAKGKKNGISSIYSAF